MSCERAGLPQPRSREGRVPLGGHLQQPPRAGEECKDAGEECKDAADSSVTTQDEAWRAGSREGPLP